ncbi:MAG: hypothetical protein ACJ79S_21930 [Gemmatimonadaceae bacterium]
MRGIAISMLAVAAPLPLAELPSAGAAPAAPASLEAPPLSRDDAAAAQLAAHLPAGRGGYQVHNGRVTLDAPAA